MLFKDVKPGSIFNYPCMSDSVGEGIKTVQGNTFLNTGTWVVGKLAPDVECTNIHSLLDKFTKTTPPSRPPHKFTFHLGCHVVVKQVDMDGATSRPLHPNKGHEGRRGVVLRQMAIDEEFVEDTAELYWVGLLCGPILPGGRMDPKCEDTTLYIRCFTDYELEAYTTTAAND